jgi:hypothetical protein
MLLAFSATMSELAPFQGAADTPVVPHIGTAQERGARLKVQRDVAQQFDSAGEVRTRCDFDGPASSLRASPYGGVDRCCVQLLAITAGAERAHVADGGAARTGRRVGGIVGNMGRL